MQIFFMVSIVEHEFSENLNRSFIMLPALSRVTYSDHFVLRLTVCLSRSQTF